MAITVSLVLVLGIAAAVLLKFKAVGGVAAVILILFGFYLADTGARTTINDGVSSLLDTLRDIDS
ncbi:hypothetical protein [Streptomyces indicus]|uniref:Uncharacterized protein n=1 Tax=Streptomyces indicus TaxID=417292 RepID=A0A1G9ETM5_9ACTN|nr:hypothetical protein [Streptomyces indicus]SDK79355.1 hypothetical protein SAMN05421806_11250 [Streptomyces indicus]